MGTKITSNKIQPITTFLIEKLNSKCQWEEHKDPTTATDVNTTSSSWSTWMIWVQWNAPSATATSLRRPDRSMRQWDSRLSKQLLSQSLSLRCKCRGQSSSRSLARCLIASLSLSSMAWVHKFVNLRPSTAPTAPIVVTHNQWQSPMDLIALSHA